MYFDLEMLCISFFFIIYFLFLFFVHVVYTLVNDVLLHQFNIGPVRSIILFFGIFNHTLTHTNCFFLFDKGLYVLSFLYDGYTINSFCIGEIQA